MRQDGWLESRTMETIERRQGRRRLIKTCLWVTCYARGQPWAWVKSLLGLEPGRKFALPPGFIFRYNLFYGKVNNG